MSIPGEIKILAIAIGTYVSLRILGAPEWAAILSCVAIGEFLFHEKITNAEQEATATQLRNIVTTALEEMKADAENIKDKLDNLGNQVEALKQRSEELGNQVQTIEERI